LSAQRLARLLGDAAERSRGRAGPDEGALVDRQLLHPGLVAEDRAAADARRGVDRQDGYTVAALDQMQTQHLDEGALADARHAGQADAQRLAARGQQCVQQFVGAGPVVGPPALQQRDGPGQRASLARPPLLEQVVQQGLVGGEHVGWR